MTNAQRVKKIRTAAALAALAGNIPAVIREALACTVDLIEDFETRLAALEEKNDGKK
jgi:hypothetical protein